MDGSLGRRAAIGALIMTEPAKKQTKATAPRLAAPEFDPSKIDMPEIFREMAEKSVEQAKESYARLRSVAEEATDVAEDAYLTATRGATEFSLKAIEALRANVNANLDYARVLIGAKSLSEAVEISATHLREQFDALAAQAKEFSALAQKVASDAAEPMKSSVEKNLRLN
jgi:phasin